MLIRTYRVKPFLLVDITSHVEDCTLTNDMRKDECICALEKLNEKTDAELGAMVRVFLNDSDVRGYANDFVELEAETEVNGD